MPSRLALDIYKDYYLSIFVFFNLIRHKPKNWIEYVHSFFAEIEKSDIPQYAKENFIEVTIDKPVNFEDVYYGNLKIMTNSSKYNEWWTKQNEAGKEFVKIFKKAEDRMQKKLDGKIYEDEEKYKGITKYLILDHGYIRQTKKFDLENWKQTLDDQHVLCLIYKYYITNGKIGDKYLNAIYEELQNGKQFDEEVKKKLIDWHNRTYQNESISYDKKLVLTPNNK